MIEPKGKPPVCAALSGCLNQALLCADSRAFTVDHDNSGVRFGVRGEADTDKATVGLTDNPDWKEPPWSLRRAASSRR